MGSGLVGCIVRTATVCRPSHKQRWGCHVRVWHGRPQGRGGSCCSLWQAAGVASGRKAGGGLASMPCTQEVRCNLVCCKLKDVYLTSVSLSSHTVGAPQLWTVMTRYSRRNRQPSWHRPRGACRQQCDSNTSQPVAHEGVCHTIILQPYHTHICHHEIKPLHVACSLMQLPGYVLAANTTPVVIAQRAWI